VFLMNEVTLYTRKQARLEHAHLTHSHSHTITHSHTHTLTSHTLTLSHSHTLRHGSAGTFAPPGHGASTYHPSP